MFTNKINIMSDNKLRLHFGDQYVIQKTLDKFMELYKKSVDMRRWIKKISWMVGSKWFYRKNKITGEAISDVKILENLNLIINKNDLSTYIFTFIRDTLILWTTLALKVRSETLKWIWIQWLDIRNIQFILDPYWDIKSIKVLQNEQVYRIWDIKMYKDESDPDIPLLGMSIIEPLIYELWADYQVQVQNYAYFKNEMIPWSLIILDDKYSNATAEQKQELSDNIKKMFGGSEKKYKSVIIPWVKEIKKIQDSINDMQFELLRKMTSEKVAVMLGMSKSVLWYSEHAGMWSNTSDVKDRAFVRDTIMPRHKAFEDFINSMIVNESEYKDIEFVMLDNYIDNTKETIDYYANAIATWLYTIDEARQFIGEQPFWLDNTKSPIIKIWFELVDDIWFTPNTNNQ